jgi:2-methylisocitrate lyase-like PEP mutase family enzyme
LRSQREKAEAFRSLHHGEHILILPNCWDVPSARVFEEAGFPAIATSSAGIMVSLGYPDGEQIPKGEYFAAVARVAKVLSVPLSVDTVAGFGGSPKEVAQTAKTVIKLGGVGVNIEDFAHEKRTLFPLESQIQKVKAVREAGRSLGVPLVINARTDAFRYARGDEKARLDEAIRRASAFRDAGADCVYPMGVADAASITQFVRALDFPVNVMARPGLPGIAELERMGVARVSLGPTPSYAAMGLLKRIARELLEKGTYQSLLDGAITFDELNKLALPRS